ncbi:MAG: hypothetical protein HC921_03695 [Synechococcaceae cyanobacterium SM2_3_1]|nr:hypothetical protein [Synechococcaceae cyanobacterium SM2_3_1]
MQVGQPRDSNTTLLCSLLEETYRSSGNPQPVFQLLTEHLDQLPLLGSTLQQWTQQSSTARTWRSARHWRR